MYHRKINPKAIIPFALSFTAAQLVCAGFASAKNYELNYIDVNGGQEGIIIQDTIADDKSYDITVNIDNPVRGEDWQYHQSPGGRLSNWQLQREY